MPKVRVRDIEMYYELKGAGRPVVLIGGLAGDARAWAPQVEVLSKTYQVLAFDNRGTGRSDCPPGPYTTRLFAEDTVALMDALSLPAAHVIGRSMGGAIAQEVALNFPDRVRSLVITASFGKLDRYGAQILENIMEVVKAQGYRAAAKHQSLFFFPPAYFNTHKEELDAFEKLLGNVDRPVHAYVASTLACIEHDALDRLDHIKCPTLVLAGQADVLCSVQCSREIVKRVPKAELKVLKGTSHFFLVQKPEETMGYILDFLKNVDRTRRAPAKPPKGKPAPKRRR